jgi:DNA-binding response OmpR family regulator
MIQVEKMIKKSKKKQILIADDEKHIIDLMKIILQEKFEILTAENGQEVMELLKTNKPDLLILDVMMPEVNGFEVCEQLKSNSKTKSLKIVMISAKAQEKDIVQGLKLGADYYMTKPFDPIIFDKKINEIINGDI